MRGEYHRDVTTSSAASNELKLTVQIIAVAGVFFVCQLPQIMAFVLVVILSLDGFPEFPEHYFLVCFLINSILMTINSSANFFIYCVTGAMFRNAVSQCFRCVPAN